MAGLGWTAPFPLDFGAEPSAVETIWRALRDAMGDAAGPEDGLLDIWTQAEATALDMAAAQAERAAAQGFPFLATEDGALPGYEQLLAASSQSDVEEERVQFVREEWNARARPALSMDELLSVELPFVARGRFSPSEAIKTYVAVKGFGEWTNLNYGATKWPNYSTSMILRLVSAAPLATDQTELVRRFMIRHLPAWVDWEVLDGGTPSDLPSSVPDFSIVPSGGPGTILERREWTDPAGPGVGQAGRLNPLPGNPPYYYRFQLQFVGAITFSAVVGGVVGPLDAALGGNLFTWQWIESPGAPPAITTPPGQSSVATSTVMTPGHYVMRATRANVGAVLFHFDVEQ